MLCRNFQFSFVKKCVNGRNCWREVGTGWFERGMQHNFAVYQDLAKASQTWKYRDCPMNPESSKLFLLISLSIYTPDYG